MIHVLFFKLNARSRQMKPAVGVRFNVVRFMPSIIRANCICGSGANGEIVRFTTKSRNHAVGGGSWVSLEVGNGWVYDGRV